ncbi:hypothetical protein EVAR_92788_1 [Eumeta japonica]|uniref:Uncharacterized protein n=1 Tax=Eumeta variegata TaxID=151549 RepID=A0A4C2A8D1_EUMVA|nr:hypothetical protein EVAR_92788_1 [Eumeta japonica]
MSHDKQAWLSIMGTKCLRLCMVVKAGYGRRKVKVGLMQWRCDSCEVCVEYLGKMDVETVMLKSGFSTMRQDLSSGIFYELGHVFQKSTIVHSIRVGISEVKLCFQKTPSVQRYYFDDLIGEAPLLQLSADQENKMGR